jgi:pimeloyl-ACP methyl ester carboxylesterase
MLGVPEAIGQVSSRGGSRTATAVAGSGRTVLRGCCGVPVQQLSRGCLRSHRPAVSSGALGRTNDLASGCGGYFSAQWKYGLNMLMQEVSREQAPAKTHIPILLVHGQIDSNIPVRHSRRIHLLDPEIVLWEGPARGSLWSDCDCAGRIRDAIAGGFGGESSSPHMSSAAVKSAASSHLLLTAI